MVNKYKSFIFPVYGAGCDHGLSFISSGGSAHVLSFIFSGSGNGSAYERGFVFTSGGSGFVRVGLDIRYNINLFNKNVSISRRYMSTNNGKKIRGNRLEAGINVTSLGSEDKNLLNNGINNNYDNFKSDMLLPDNLKVGEYNRLGGDNLQNIFNKELIKLPSNLRGGFNGYEVLLIEKDVDSSRFNKVEKGIQELLSGMEDDKVYSLLFLGSDINSNVNLSYSILPRSILVCKKTSASVLSRILKKYLIILESKYEFYSTYNLIVQGRIWYSKEEILKKIIADKGMKYKNGGGSLNSNLGLGEDNAAYDSVDLDEDSAKSASNDSDLKFNKLSEAVYRDLNNLEIEDSNRGGDYVKKSFRHVIRRCIEITLTPHRIKELEVISSDYSSTIFNYKSKIKGNSFKLLMSIYSNMRLYRIVEDDKLLEGWVDTYLEDSISRQFGDNNVLYSAEWEGKKYLKSIKEINLGYNFKNLKQLSKTHEKDNKIGVIDLETYTCKDDGSQRVYAGGWAVKNNKKLYYVDEYGYDSVELLKKLFLDILESEYHDHTFFVHNLSGFDYIFILSGLTGGVSPLNSYSTSFINSESSTIKLQPDSIREGDVVLPLKGSIKEVDEFGFEIAPIIKDDNTLVSLKISRLIVVESGADVNDVCENTASASNHFKGDELNGVGKKKPRKGNKKKMKKRSITLLDSALFLKDNLRNLAKEFNCDFQKGFFPYKFVTDNNLTYKGDTPSLNFFPELTIKEYEEIFPKGSIYDLKGETFKYLESDLLSLLEIMISFSYIIYDEFAINITSCKSMSGVSFKIYFSNFYNNKYNIKEIKGKVEKEIRKSYYGGLVVLPEYGKIIHNEGQTPQNIYYYDFNSFYPSLMLKQMPVGNPTLSNSADLSSYFGFCYAKITPPSNLKNYLIPFRGDTGNIECPKEPFEGIYFSELLKESLKYGYKVDVLGGFKFEKGLNIFDSFINDLFGKRLEAKMENKFALQLTFKLILNSLYGRFGMKDIINRVEIVDKEKAEELLKNKNISLYCELNEKYLLKYNTNISQEITDLVDSFTLSKNKGKGKGGREKKINSLANIVKQRGVPSSIAIASAITSYGIMALMPFKNDDSNKLIYSDTDSIIMEKELDANLVDPTALGKLKLEHVITEAYFIAPKFYGFKNVKGEIIVKTKGIGRGKIAFEDLIKLSQGEDINIKSTVFIKNLKEGTVNIKEQDYLIKGVTNI